MTQLVDTVTPMLDFTQSREPKAQRRCQQRAKVARKAARTLRVVLVGLVGAALISEPGLVGATRNGVATMHASLQGPSPVARNATSAFALPITIATMQIGDEIGSGGDVVAQGDIDLLGNLLRPTNR